MESSKRKNENSSRCKVNAILAAENLDKIIINPLAKSVAA